MRPEKLKRGDLVAIIAPSLSLDIISSETVERATHFLAIDMGLTIKLMPNVRDNDDISKRVKDLHAAFEDSTVKAIFTVIGGFNCNELLPFIDYELIRCNPKILCGYSDITALAVAINAMTGLVTYCGPHFSTMALAATDGCEMIKDGLRRLLLEDDHMWTLTASTRYRDDAWYEWGSPEWNFNEGPHFLSHEKTLEKTPLMGGNLAVLSLLQGTPFLSSFPPCVVLFLEWCAEYQEGLDLCFFTQRLFSLLQCLRHCGSVCCGLLFGRFQVASKIENVDLQLLVGKLKRCGMIDAQVPVVANLDFGHTFPMHVIPIGGHVCISTDGRICVSDI